ncbi:S8 family serine peptidase, partial [Pseudomonadota bacterium]
MTRILYTLLVAFTALCVSGETFAQSDTGLSNRKAKLQALSAKLKQRDQADRRQAREYARRLGIPLRRELPNGRVLELQRIAPGIGPVFYITNNVDAADTVSTDEVWPAGSAGLDLDGGGMTIGEWDGGAVFGHEDFTDLTAPPALRVTQVDKDDGPEESGHATHVAGTLVGNGESGLHPVYSPQARGMAYAAHLDAYDWNGDTAEMAAAGATEISPSLDGLLVSNHSYGIAAGWLFMGYDVLPPFRWLWIGGETNFGQDPNFGYYETETAYWDTIAYDAPYYLIVKAAGNDRTDTGPLPLEEYTIIDQNAVILGTSTDTRPADCAPAGYDCLPTTSVAKNILTVGAVDDVIGGYSPFAGPSSVHMAEMSGWGPTDDGRIKPDLVGNGMLLVSTWNDDPYIAAAGTSMAAPNVSGSLLLLQQHYDNIHGSTGNFMRAATLKALAIHTADEAGDADGPDYAFGWGLLNTKAAAQMITDDASIDNEVRNHNRIIEDSLADGTANFIDITTTETDAIITATLVWADPPGTPIAPPLTETDRLLVNDLDLRIKIDPSTEYMPWTLDPAEPAAPATTGDNDRDNVEQVLIDGAGAGTYRFEVSHKGALLDSISQDYSLIISVV